MRPGLSVRVKVLSEAGAKPIAGARVQLLQTDGDRDHFTSAQGEVELLALTPESWSIKATAADHAAEVRVINLASEQPAALEIKLPPGGSLQGQVQDENGQPLSGVAIDVR